MPMLSDKKRELCAQCNRYVDVYETVAEVPPVDPPDPPVTHAAAVAPKEPKKP
jgi:hypothetical protein